MSFCVKHYIKPAKNKNNLNISIKRRVKILKLLLRSNRLFGPSNRILNKQ